MTSTAAPATSTYPTAEPVVASRTPGRITLLVIGGLIAITAVTCALWKARAWAEIVGTGVVRTTASASDIAAARNAVIERHRNIISNADGTRIDPTSNERSQRWRSGPSRDDVETEVSRAKSEIVDKAGRTISIESIRSTDAPTLVFLQSSDTGLTLELLSELMDELRKQGVDVD